jgi:tetratricopeptide (TPR) repeat protein
LESARGLAALQHEMGRTREAAEVATWTGLAFGAATAGEDAAPGLLDDFALFLLEGQPPSVRDPPRALALAERAVAVTGRRDYLRLRTLSTAQRTVGRTDDAIATLREALALPDAIQSWTLERALVELMHEHRSAAELEAWLLQRLGQYPRYGRGDDFAVARTLRHLADLYEREGRLDDAERRLTEALAQARKTVGDAHFEVAETKVVLASVQAARGYSAAIERMLAEGFAALIADYRSGHSARAAARERVAAVYDRWGRAAAAARWRQRPLQ